MSVALGQNLVVGFGVESTYATGVAPSLFVKVDKEGFGRDQKYEFKTPLGDTSRNRKTKTKLKVPGSLEIPLGYAGYETLFKNAFGGVATTHPGTLAYQHVFSLTSALPTGLSFHVNRDSANIANPTAYRYRGCQISKLTLKHSIEDFLMGTFTVAGAGEDKVTAASASYPTFVGIDWLDLTSFTVGGVAKPVSEWEATVDNALADDRYKLGSAEVKGMGRKGVKALSGKYTMEFEDAADYDTFANLSNVAIVITYTGALIEVGHNFSAVLSFPVCNLSSAKISAEDAGPITMPIEFDASASTGNDEATLTLITTTSSVT